MKQYILKTFNRLHAAFGERLNSATRAPASDASKAAHSRGPVLCGPCVGASVEAVSVLVERSPMVYRKKRGAPKLGRSTKGETKGKKHKSKAENRAERRKPAQKTASAPATATADAEKAVSKRAAGMCISAHRLARRLAPTRACLFLLQVRFKHPPKSAGAIPPVECKDVGDMVQRTGHTDANPSG